MGARSQREAQAPHRWMVFGTISAIYFLSYFHRISPSVIVPDLLADFQTHATALGLMSSMYFYLYAVEQPLVGYLSDRLGPRRVIGLWSLAATGGCILFAVAPSVAWASAGRGLIGFGVGGVFIPGIKALSQWFRQRDFATLTGFFLAAGNLGGIVATAPLAWTVERWGWRSSFLAVGAITLGLAVATLWGLRDYRPSANEGPSRQSQGDSRRPDTWKAARQVLTSSRFWILFIIFFGAFGAYGTLQGLWATPFLMAVLGLERMEASLLSMLLPAGFILGAPCSGWIADRVARDKGNMLLGILSAEALLWAGLILGSDILGGSGMAALLFLMGATTGGMATTFWSFVRRTTPGPVLGLTTGLLNPSPFLGAALLQVWTGALLDHVGQVDGLYPPEAFRSALWVCMATTALPTALALCLRRRLGPIPPHPPGRPPGIDH